MQPLVTIAIPFYNNQDTILDSIKSVFLQTYPNWELLLLNDGSRDNSLSLVENIKDNRVKIISDDVNRGLVYRLNQIPKLASGIYLARMDADDLMHPDRISKQMEVLLADSDIDVVDTGTYSIDEIGNPIGMRGLDAIQDDPNRFVGKARLLHASIVGKKTWFLEHPYDANYVRAEDCELWCRTYKNSKFARVCEPLYIVREGKINVSNYIQGVRTVQKILLKYNYLMNKKHVWVKEFIKTYFKIGIYKSMGFFQLQHILTRRRNCLLTLAQKELLSKLIVQIQSYELPILD